MDISFDHFPSYDLSRIAIKLKPFAERHIKKRHPWVFSDAIDKQNKDGQAGDLAIVFDRKTNKFLAAGLYDPDSPIRIKLFQFHDKAIINEEWFEQKVKTAFDRRTPLFITDTNSYRFIFGENDGLPGFIVDVYDHVMVIKIYSKIWFPYLKDLLIPLIKFSECTVGILRLSRRVQEDKSQKFFMDGQVIFGEMEGEEIIFKEHGLRFSANVIRGHKTGYFLDHRHNRKRIGALANGKKVLDVFSYAGGFSVHAIAGNAQEVTSVDISKQALQMAQKNVALNEHTGTHKTIAGDAFEILAKLQQQGNRYDLIIIDPPSFAKKKEEVNTAKKHYVQLAELGASLISSGGILLLASCSSRISKDDFKECCFKGIKQTGKTPDILEETTHDIDHPIGFEEGAYLKSIYLRF